MRAVRIRTGIIVVVLLMSVAWFGQGTASAGTDAPARAGIPTVTVAKVKIIDFAFKPKALHVAKGTRVKWVNKGSVSHTTTSNTGLWDSGPLAPGASFSRVFKKAGTFRFHCSIHPDMKGKIVVG